MMNHIVFTSSLKRTFLAGMLILGMSAGAVAAVPSPTGNVPEGLWKLNLKRSIELRPVRAQTLWVAKDDGKEIVTAMTIVDGNGITHFVTWTGQYGGEPTVAAGIGLKLNFTLTAPGRILINGTGPDGSTFREHCEILNARRRFVCRGESTKDGVVSKYADDYDFYSPNPSW